MLNTYKATLKGNRLEWSGEKPEHVTPKRAVAVHVTILEEVADSPAKKIQGQRMADALKQLADAHALTEIRDPAAWEREIRQDRPLPDRDS